VAAQSQTDLCNGALQLLGVPSIVAITDNTPAARACSVAYDCTRRDELRKHKWNFAIKRVQLAPSATAPAFYFAYQFPLPADCLRVLLPDWQDDLDWVIEGRQVLTNNCNGGQTDATGAVLNLRYVADITDVTQWDSAFYNVFQIALAQTMCEQLTNSTSKKTTLDREYQEAQEEAKRNNAFENISVDAPDDTWWLARDGGGAPLGADTTVNFTISS